MSNSLRLQGINSLKFYFFLALFVIVCSEFASSLDVGVSPSSVDFSAVEGEQDCEEINVFSSRLGLYLELYDKWNPKSDNSRDIEKYVINAYALNISLDYQKNIRVGRNATINVCFRATKAGRYNGLLIVDVVNGSASLGVWLNAESKSSTNKGITSFAIKEVPAGVLPILLFNLLLFGLLLLLLIRMKKQALR